MASAQSAGGEINTAEVSERWAADAFFASYPVPCRLAGTESWVTDRKTERLGVCFSYWFSQGSSMNQTARQDEQSFLTNGPKGGGGGGVSWKVGRSLEGRNQVLEGRGSERLESDGGNWVDDIAGEICPLIWVGWRAGCWGRVVSRSQSPGPSRFGGWGEKSHRGLVQPRLDLRSGQGKSSPRASKPRHDSKGP